jgi:hypothetical protein
VVRRKSMIMGHILDGTSPAVPPFQRSRRAASESV